MKMHTFVFILIFAAGTLCATVQAQDKAAAAPGAAQTTAAQEPAADSSAILATVGTWGISLDEFNQALKKLTPVLAQQKVVMGPDFKEQMLNELVEQEIMAQIAISKGKDKDQDLRKARERYRSALLAAKLMEEMGERIVVSPAEVKKFYDANKEVFANPPREIKIQEILTASETEARDIIGRLAKNEDFAAIAKKSSKSESAKAGGDLGFISTKTIILTLRGIEPPAQTAQKPETNLPQRPAAFWEKARTLEKGKISDIIKAEDGTCYIIKVSDVKGGKDIPTLGEVSPFIEQYLKMNLFQEEIDRLVADFKASNKVEINAGLLQ